MIRAVTILTALLFAYAALIGPFVAQMQRRPFQEKLGYVPESSVLRITMADQKSVAAANLVFRTMMYYGGLSEKEGKGVVNSPDFTGMERMLVAATRLDPYNMDAYYFGQATLVWDMNHFSEANALLEYGMQYRTWDFYLPFFAGFNAAYFLKDFENAARYYRRAGEITGDGLFISLAGRYLYETGATEQAITYLTMMVKGASNNDVRKNFETRLEALKGVRMIEVARDRYQDKNGQLPKDLDALRNAGFLATIPVDPYGGTFFIADDGAVRSTSNLYYKVEKDKKQ